MPKSMREIVEIVEVFDLTRRPEDAGRLAGCEAKCHVPCESLRPRARPRRRPAPGRIIDPFVEGPRTRRELPRRFRADVVGDEHTCRDAPASQCLRIFTTSATFIPLLATSHPRRRRGMLNGRGEGEESPSPGGYVTDGQGIP